MSVKRIQVKQLILLVGSNPLPNYLAVLILNPESVCFLYTKETKDVKKRIWGVLQQRLPALVLKERFIEDASSPVKIRESFPAIDDETHLHYTGGTKIMAAHALMTFFNKGGTGKRASYIDERKSMLRFDDDNVMPIDISKVELNLTIKEILGLHGISVITIGSDRQPDTALPSIEDAKAIAGKVLNDPSFACMLYDKVKEMPEAISKAMADPFRISQHVPGLSVDSIPAQDWDTIRYKAWRKFLQGGWLEHWSADLIRQIKGEGSANIDIQCLRENRRGFQIDVMLVVAHRLYVISCTTESEDLNLCKSKLFEVATRARQLGGDLSRAAFISLLHGTITNRKVEELKMDLLRNDIENIWEASNEVQAYGLDDVRSWYGVHGSPNVHNLKAWLEK
ncbi:MAG: DUF1887 family protein [Syntrophaceae bacterium]|nr:DUF1887 family protein [Syntrophaceae bacterium]